MENRTRSPHGCRHAGAAKAIQRLHLEVFAKRKYRLLRQKGITVASERMTDHWKAFRELVANEHFRWGHARKFILQSRYIRQLREPKLARANVDEGKPKEPSLLRDGGEVVVPLGIEQVDIGNGPGTDHLGQLAVNDFSRLRLADLITNR